MLFSSSPLLILLALGCGRRSGPALEQAAVQEGEGDPLAVLTQATASLDPGVRGKALAVLIEHEAAQAGGEWGPRALYDPNPYVQRLAVDALAARLPEDPSADLLVAFVKRGDVDPYTRGHAAVELALAGDTRARGAISEAWQVEPARWRRAPLALGALALGDEAALEPLTSALAGGDMPLEIPFFLDCGRVGRTELAEPMIEGLDLLEETLYLPTAMALIQLEHKEGERLVRDALADPDVEVRLEAVDYLADLDHPEAEKLLNKARLGGPEPVRSYAVLAQVARGGEPGPAFEAALSPDREVRSLGIWALAGYIGSAEGNRRQVRQAHKTVRAALADAEPAVVQQAVLGLARVGRPSDRSALAFLLHDEAIGLTVEAAAAILAIDGRGEVAEFSPDSAASSSE